MRYIEVVGGVGIWRCYLNAGEPVTGNSGYSGRGAITIGEFTRENVAKYLEICSGPEGLPIEDFHAVCGDIDIPWATEEARRFAPRLFSQF